MPAAAPESDTLNSFQIQWGDFAWLWKELLGLDCRDLSPFAARVNAPSASPVTDVAALTALAKNPVLAHAASIVSDPDLRLECVLGGGSASIGHVTLYRRRQHAGAVALTPSVEGAFLLHCFPDTPMAARWLAHLLSRIPDFVAWDVDTLSEMGATLELPREIPGEMPFETLLYLLHAIDVFRRGVYRNLLDYRPVEGSLTVTAAEFDETLGAALRSGDVRWLLPAFHRLTPGLADLRVEPRPEHLEILARADLIHPVRTADTGEARYRFGEVGTRVGVEFYRTWHSAASIARTLRGQRGPGLRAFLAPTAFANHLFEVETRRDGHGAVHHHPLDEAGLAEWLGQVLAPRATPGAPKPAP